MSRVQKSSAIDRKLLGLYYHIVFSGGYAANRRKQDVKIKHFLSLAFYLQSSSTRREST